ncbi:uncharacterized protein Ecym_2098 [Eremothecium cymbalariae DBVPG|uniref:Uncharacterized protein n=1 Tax=Eremothecium cymbalariae (strain CBS 270.75 / DBVPG 7215 / KCTC 17166 / NRRL Y-17582) TaxID=931890 RepID=G8JPK2_ERECY|nr:Hypothetical protein Ecym_2098 [Eremothecium cymbalariae DBVPG\
MVSILGPLSKGIDALNALNDHYYKLSVDEQKAMSFLERVKLYNWTFEECTLVVLMAVYIMYWIGTKINTGFAKRMFEDLNYFFLNDLQFARAGFSQKDGSKVKYVTEQNNTWFTTFATGRSCIESITVRAHYYPRFNPVVILMERLLAQFFPQFVEVSEEFVQVTVCPNGKWVKDGKSDVQTTDDAISKFRFIASVVNKTHMNDSRKKNYFLSLTHTTESDSLPIEYVFMSETNQLNQFFTTFTNGPSFHELLVKCKHFLQFISFTDLPEEKPVTDKLWESTQQPRCVIQCSNITSDQDIRLLKDLIAAIVDVYDTVTKEIVNKSPALFLSNDVLKKSVQMRKDELSKIIKVMKQVEREMAQEKKAEEDKKKWREMRDKQGTQDQDKLDQKMRDKRERRRRNKLNNKM